VDARGMGVRTKIVPLLVKQNGVAPEFEATDDYLIVRMYRGPAARGQAAASDADA
jgi:ATP-dependent DNA helicase RecG